MEPQRVDDTHAAFEDLLGAAALGTLEPEERRALDAHLATCGSCPAELARLRAAVVAYPLALDDRQPPAALRARIETAVRRDLPDSPRAHDPPRLTRLSIAPADAPEMRPIPRGRPRSAAGNPWAVAAALLLVASLGLLVWNLQLRGEAPTEEAVTVALQPTDPALAVDGDLTYLADRGVALISVRALPPLAPGQVFQAWVIRDGEPPVPAGTFGGTDTGLAISVDRERYQTVALTIESGPLGNLLPTGNPIATAPLPPA